ncbi:MAG: hypothetical protein O2820_06545 [Planctomycetota bacterium]|nr:hypothetical protein [Planctomycetota bacterium]
MHFDVRSWPTRSANLVEYRQGIGRRDPDDDFVERTRRGNSYGDDAGGPMTGNRIERASASGTRPGIELRPSIVVIVRFERIQRHDSTGDLSLRDPKLVVIRSGKSATEADTVKSIEELYLRERVC